MQAAFDWYAARSGLAPASDYSLDDHMFGYWASLSSLSPKPTYSQRDHEDNALVTLYPSAPSYLSVTDLEEVHFTALAAAAGLTIPPYASLDDLKNAVYTGSGAPPVSAGYGLGPYGTMPYGQ